MAGLQTIYRRWGKRAFDVVISAISLLIFSPVAAIVGLAIRFNLGRPVLFRQVRIGEGSRLFNVIKFRTMVVGAERMGSGLYLSKGDGRVPRLGGFLRKTSLDELPQFFNVLKGDMSVVGPRPMVSVIVEECQAEYDVILTVRPGITGLAQVSGREDLPRSQRLGLDLEYVRSVSLRLDLKIILKTIMVVFSRRGQRDHMTPFELER